MYFSATMTSWKSSTLLVLAAFTTSVVLLFTKSGMHSTRALSERVVVSNHIYSPAAADPDLRVPERAERLRRVAQPVQASATNVRPQHDRPAASATKQTKSAAKLPTPESKAATPPVKQVEFNTHPVPEGHVFYVVMATFSSRSNAERGLKDFKRRGLQKAFVGTFDEGKFYSVIGNTFARESSARYMINELKEKHGVNAYIYHRKD